MPIENEENIGLTGEEISKETRKRLEKYNGLNFFEEFSMFMGTAQILEFGLKNRVKIDLPNESILFNFFLVNQDYNEHRIFILIERTLDNEIITNCNSRITICT